MRNPMRNILYKLNENSNNPADLLVGETVVINHYNDNGDVDSNYSGTIELITNTVVVVNDPHTDESHDFKFNGFNARLNSVEFIDCKDPNFRFYI